MFDNFLKFFRSFAGGVESAHQAAHAGASDVVNWNVMVFKPVQNADVRETERAAAFESDSDFGARALFLRGCDGWLVCGIFLCGCEQREQENHRHQTKDA